MIKSIKKILYASDIKKGARPAFRAALDLCGHYEAEIIYLHVVRHDNVDSSAIQAIFAKKELKKLYENSLDLVKEDITQRIDRFFVEEMAENECLSLERVKSIVREGKPWEVIVEVAEEIGADMIVMGSRKHAGLGHALISSTGSKVIAHSNKPVLTVPL